MSVPCDTLLLAEHMLTQNTSREHLQNAAVAITGSEITELGPAEQLLQKYQASETIDLGRSLLLPGFVNTHTHSPMTLFRGAADDLPLQEWLEKGVWPLEGRLTEALVHLGSLLACAEMIRTGTTMFTDSYIWQEHTATAVDACGLRAIICEGLLAFPTCSYQTPDEAFAINERLFEAYAKHPRIRGGVSPHTMYTTTPEIRARSAELADKYGVLWMTHLAESQEEIKQCLDRFGKRPFAMALEEGLLHDRSMLVHGVWLEEEEIRTAVELGVSLAHAPRSNMKLASGVAPITRMRELGLRMGLGTDGAASNNTLSMFAEMQTLALTQKGVNLNATALPAQAVLDMATVEAAQSIGWEELGTLAPGRPADIIALDLSAPGLQPVHNPLSHTVYAAQGADVRLTMVAGKMLYLDGKYLTIDYPALLRETAGVVEWVKELQSGA